MDGGGNDQREAEENGCDDDGRSEFVLFGGAEPNVLERGAKEKPSNGGEEQKPADSEENGIGQGVPGEHGGSIHCLVEFGVDGIVVGAFDIFAHLAMLDAHGPAEEDPVE